jgi:hypothetical protein
MSSARVLSVRLSIACLFLQVFLYSSFLLTIWVLMPSLSPSVIPISQQDYSVPHLEQRAHLSTPPAPTNDDIEAVIQMATSSGMSQDSRSPAPLRDTRTQLFVGNVRMSVD